MTCLSPKPGENLRETVGRLVAGGELDQDTADVALEFSAFLRDLHQHGDPEQLGLTREWIDGLEARQLAAAQVGPTTRNVPRSVARPVDAPVYDPTAGCSVPCPCCGTGVW